VGREKEKKRHLENYGIQGKSEAETSERISYETKRKNGLIWGDKYEGSQKKVLEEEEVKK